MSLVTLNNSLFSVLQYFVMFSGIILELVTLKISFYSTYDWTSKILSFHILDLSYVGSFSLSLCILVSQKCAARLNFFTLWVIPIICLHSADFTWWQIWLNKCITENAQRRIFLSIPISSLYSSFLLMVDL